MQAADATVSKPPQTHIEETASVVTINSLAALNTLFDKLDYHETTWKQESKVVPRISFKGIGDNWSTKSNQLPVNTKKSIFFRLITPLVLIANEQVIAERHIVKTAPLSSEKLLEIALKYRILDVKNKNKLLTEAQRVSLLARVDILPPSLAVAQAAEESGWGTSRFASKGNALFGQWDFSGNGMKPKQQRKELGNYGVARFDSPLASVEAYIFNINSNAAYLKLRVLRAELRANNTPVTGTELAGTLDKYSERGEAYTEGLRQMIRFNKLETLDTLTLSKEKLIHLNTDG
ncbi:glucosaminidase [Psychromonas sp. Urea-02u-13]|nr:glucosaminidase [Psychromonas sp. Urea-02u-13]